MANWRGPRSGIQVGFMQEIVTRVRNRTSARNNRSTEGCRPCRGIDVASERGEERSKRSAGARRVLGGFEACGGCGESLSVGRCRGMECLRSLASRSSASALTLILGR